MAVFWEDRQEQAGKDWVRVERDEPWQAGPVYWAGRKSDILEQAAERQSLREQRLRAGWAEAGFVEVNGHRVAAAEVQLAERAKEMAGFGQKAVAEDLPVVPVVEEKTAPAGPVDVPAPPGILKQWGAHAALLICAAFLIAVVAKVFFLTHTE